MARPASRNWRNKVVQIAESGASQFSPLYPDDMELFDKINTIVKRIYRGSEAIADKSVRDQLKAWEEAGYGNLPVCMAKTQYSFSTDPNLRGAPTGHTVAVREVRLSAGAGFVVVICGEVMTMPGLPKTRRRKRSSSTTRARSKACSKTAAGAPGPGALRRASAADRRPRLAFQPGRHPAVGHRAVADARNAELREPGLRRHMRQRDDVDRQRDPLHQPADQLRVAEARRKKPSAPACS